MSTAVWIYYSDLCVYLALEVPYIRQRKPRVRITDRSPNDKPCGGALSCEQSCQNIAVFYDIHGNRLLIVNSHFPTGHKLTAIHSLFSPPVQWNTANLGGTECFCKKTAFASGQILCTLMLGVRLSFRFSAALLIFLLHHLPLFVLTSNCRTFEHPPSSY